MVKRRFAALAVVTALIVGTVYGSAVAAADKPASAEAPPTKTRPDTSPTAPAGVPAAATGTGSAIDGDAGTASKKSTVKLTIDTDSTTHDEDATADAEAPTTNAARGQRTRRGRAHIEIGDRDFDSFTEAMQNAPWVVGLLFLLLATLFLTPVFLLFGIIWYKLRKTRLQNDAMLKLAEKGVMPGPQPDAVVAGAAAASPTAQGVAGNGFQQVVMSRRRAAWSDLRKGVILIAVGLSFVFYSMTDSGTPNWLGLLLMFVGIGYIVLWWLEDRHLEARATVPPTINDRTGSN